LKYNNSTVSKNRFHITLKWTNKKGGEEVPLSYIMSSVRNDVFCNCHWHLLAIINSPYYTNNVLNGYVTDSHIPEENIAYV